MRLFSTEEADQPTSSVAEASLAFVSQGRKQVAVNDRVWQYGPGDYLIVSVDLPVTGQFLAASKTEPFLGVGLTLDIPTIAALLTEIDGGDPLRATTAQGPALGVSAATDDLLDAIARLLRLLDEPGDCKILAPLITREITWRLLRGPHGNMLKDIATNGSALALIGSAVRVIRSHYAQPLRVEELAEHAAMSVPSFHRHFRNATTMSPIQYQKKIRLQQARMSFYGSTTSITAVAHAVGYESPSQFSREYLREYGISPSQDAERVRRPRSSLTSE